MVHQYIPTDLYKQVLHCKEKKVAHKYRTYKLRLVCLLRHDNRDSLHEEVEKMMEWSCGGLANDTEVGGGPG